MARALMEVLGVRKGVMEERKEGGKGKGGNGGKKKTRGVEDVELNQLIKIEMEGSIG